MVYDDDRNMLSDGEWTYSWNGENRLIAAEKPGDTKLEVAYDYMGRRVEKKGYCWDGLGMPSSACLARLPSSVGEW